MNMITLKRILNILCKAKYVMLGYVILYYVNISLRYEYESECEYERENEYKVVMACE